MRAGEDTPCKAAPCFQASTLAEQAKHLLDAGARATSTRMRSLRDIIYHWDSLCMAVVSWPAFLCVLNVSILSLCLSDLWTTLSGNMVSGQCKASHLVCLARRRRRSCAASLRPPWTDLEALSTLLNDAMVIITPSGSRLECKSMMRRSGLVAHQMLPSRAGALWPVLACAGRLPAASGCDCLVDSSEQRYVPRTVPWEPT